MRKTKAPDPHPERSIHRRAFLFRNNPTNNKKGNMRKTKSSLPNGNNTRALFVARPLAPGRKALLCTLRRASMTVEAALAVPLFFLALTCLICMMDLYAMTAAAVVRLQEQAETAAIYLGYAGDYAPEYIDLPQKVSYRPRWYPEALPSVQIAVRARVKAWTGRRPGESPAAQAETDTLVYITEHGHVYHRSSSCSHLALSVRSVTSAQADHLRNHSGERYHACEKCVGSGNRNGVVFITEEGNRFHNASDCSGLTRSVRLVRVSEADGLPPCSRCAGH